MWGKYSYSTSEIVRRYCLSLLVFHRKDIYRDYVDSIVDIFRIYNQEYIYSIVDICRMDGLNQEFLYSSVDIFRMHELNQEYLYSSVDIF